MRPAPDETIRDVLRRVDERYLDPSRIDPPRMIAAARAALDAGWPEGKAPTSLPCSVDGTSLPDVLGPALERLIVLATQRGLDAVEMRATLLDAALRRLDRYCRAFGGADRRRMLGRFNGTIGAIGIRLGRRGGRPTVLGCMRGGPAESAGVLSGDHLCGVDGRTTADCSISTVLARVRGPVGSLALLELDRRGRRIELRVARVRQEQVVVSTRAAPRDARIIRIATLNRRTPRQFDRALASRGGPSCDGLVLDLRGNSGGSMLAAAAIADRFIADGVLIEALDRHDRPVPGLRPRVDASPRADLATPLVALVDGRTASSAELLAATLRRAGRATIVGCRTFGKTVVQQLEHHDDADLTTKLSVAYLRARGTRLPPGGLEPDRAIPLAERGQPERWIRAALSELRRPTG